MKRVLETTTTVAEDKAQLDYAISQAIKEGYNHPFKSTAIAWYADNRYHFDVANSGEYCWQNSKGREVVIFLLSAGTCKGYDMGEFEINLSG